MVKILEVGRRVKNVEPGQRAIIFCTGVEDRWGYPQKIMAYDAPGTYFASFRVQAHRDGGQGQGPRIENNARVRVVVT